MRKLVALDFDGVVADTLPALYKAYISFLSDYGLVGSKQEFDSCNGLKLSEIVLKLKEEHCIEKNYTELEEKYDLLMNSYVCDAGLIPGAEELIKTLYKKKIPVVITSSASKNYIEKFLSARKLMRYVTEIISGDCVQRAKPDPEIYKKVVEKYPLYDIFAVEDSVNGLFSAFNSGIKVIFFNQYGRTIDVHPYHFCINSIVEVYNSIEKCTKEGFFVRSKKISIVIEDYSPVYSTSEKSKIEKMWLTRPRDIYNGRILAYHSCEYRQNGELVLKGYITDYKHMWFSKTIKGLSEPLITIAVSGIILDDNNRTLISDRYKVTDDSGKHELIPSGGIEAENVLNDPFGFKRQIFKELLEETGVKYGMDEVEIDNLGICFDARNLDVDICMVLKCDIAKVDGVLNESEYEVGTLRVLDVKDAEEYIAENGVYTSKMILKTIAKDMV